MSQIQSGQRHQAVSFTQKEPRSSMAIMLTDYSLDASWQLRIEVESADGGYFVLGAVNTVPVNATPIKNPNRVIAVCSVPGALQWHVYADLNFGTPVKNRTVVFGEMKLSSVPEYAAGCCPLVPIPGNSVDVNGGGDQTPTGAPPIGQRITLFSGPGFATSLDVAYLGVGMAAAFAQVHDAAATGAISTGTMISIGYPFSLPATQTILLKWQQKPRRFKKGFTVALSTTQNTLTNSAETISAFGQWDPDR